MKFNVWLAAVSLATLVGFSSCEENKADEPKVLGSEIKLNNSAWPEDPVVYNDDLFISNFVDGSILKVNLRTEAVETFVSGSNNNNYPQGWGVEVVADKKWLIALFNAPFDFVNPPANPGIVRAYNLETGMQEKEWILPAGTVGNAVTSDQNGNLYIGDISSEVRIIKINTSNDQVTIWSDDNTVWPTSFGFGLGGLVYNGSDALYAGTGGGIWRIGINADGSAATPQALSLGTSNPVFSDGMTWAGDNTIYFCQNDAQQAGSTGIVYKIALSDPTTGSLSEFKTGLKDPSGVTKITFDNNKYLLVNESQFGHALGAETGNPNFPFRVLVYPLN